MLNYLKQGEETMETSGIVLSENYKKGMRQLAAGVSLITSVSAVGRVGFIATAVSSVIADPPTLLICVNKSASAHDTIADAQCFAVNVLSAGDNELVKAFSDPSRRAERFTTGEWTALETGSPILASAMVAFDCEVVKVVPYNTHTIYIGEVRSVRESSRQENPLVYHNQKMQSLAAIS